MDFRKLISFGKTSFVMSIPKAWVIKNKLKKGDLLAVEEKEGNLILSTNINRKDEKLERAEIDASKLGRMVQRTIASLYKGGYDIIKIKFSTAKELSEIQDVIKNTCIGFEIVKQEKDILLAKKISDTIYAEFDNVLRRSFLFLKSMANDSLDAAENQDKNALHNVILADQSINKFTDFCRRVLNKKYDTKFSKTPPIYYLTEEIEKLGDEYKALCYFMVENNVKLNKETARIYKDINQFLGITYDMFYKFELSRVGLFGDMKKKIDEDILRVDPKMTKKNDVIILHSLKKISERIFDMNGAIIAANYKS